MNTVTKTKCDAVWLFGSNNMETQKDNKFHTKGNT